METGENTNRNGAEVSDPIYTQVNGIYRYNYTQERLEFINSQTRIIAAFWNIPRDQWEAIPSQAEYCKNITERSNKLVADEQKKKKRLIIAGVIAVIAFIIVPLIIDAIATQSISHTNRKDVTLSVAYEQFPGIARSKFEHVEDYKGCCIISVADGQAYVSYHNGRIYKAGAKSGIHNMLDKDLG